MEKGKRIWLGILAGVILAAAAGAGVGIWKYNDLHKYDEYLKQPEAAAEKCIQEVNSSSDQYVEEASVYYYLKHRGKKAEEETVELRRKYLYNRMLEGYKTFDSYSQMTEQTLWNLRYYTFSKPEKTLLEKDGAIYFKSQGIQEEQYREDPYNSTSKLVIEYLYDDLWMGFIQAANGNWYLSEFSHVPPYDWAGNEPMTEKNKEYGKLFLEQASEEEIFRLFELASATQLTDKEWRRGFESPIELSWEDFLNLFFASLSEPEKAEAYDSKKDCYCFTEDQIGRRVWEYLGRDENDKSAAKYDGFPHGSHLLADYMPEDGEENTCEFPKEKLLDVKVYDTEGMTLKKKELRENGTVLLEIDYQDQGGAGNQEAPNNHQVMELRAMEQGCRILSYKVIDSAHESQANRVLEEFAWKQWNLVLASHYDYVNGLGEPDITRKQLTSDYEAARDFIQNMALGRTVDTKELPESAIVTDSVSIEAESNGQRRGYDLYNMEVDGKTYLLIQSYNMELTLGDSGGGVSVTLDGIPITQAVTNKREVLCEYEDSGRLKDLVRSMIGQQ